MENEVALIQRKQKGEWQMECNVCQAVMKRIPAGVSKKTGKPYNAFYTCECGNTINEDNAQPAKVAKKEPVQVHKDEPYLEGKEKNTTLMCKTDLMCSCIDAFTHQGSLNGQEIDLFYEERLKKITE